MEDLTLLLQLHLSLGDKQYHRLRVDSCLFLMDDFLNIPIIILKDKDAQREIVDKYNEMHNKAKQLQEEAKDEFKKTKVEVEKMILGEE